MTKKKLRSQNVKTIMFDVYGGHILISIYFISKSYLDKLASKTGVDLDTLYVQANQSLIQNIIISVVVMFIISFLLRNHINRLVEIIKAKEEAEHKALVKSKIFIYHES